MHSKLKQLVDTHEPMRPKHVRVNGFYNIIVTLIQLCAFVVLNYCNSIVMYAMENVTLAPSLINLQFIISCS